MPELERDKLKALCAHRISATYSADLRAALDAGSGGISTGPVPTKSLLRTYSTRAAMSRQRNGPVMGYPELVAALERTDFGELVVSKVESDGEFFAVFTDEDYSELIGVLRAPINPQHELKELLRNARQLKLREDDN